MKPTAYDGTTTPGTQPRKNMTTMGKIDTSVLMIIRWVLNVSSRSPKPEWANFVSKLKTIEYCIIASHIFLLVIITHCCSNFNGGFVKTPLSLGYRWVISSHSCIWLLLLNVGLTHILFQTRLPRSGSILTINEVMHHDNRSTSTSRH